MLASLVLPSFVPMKTAISFYQLQYLLVFWSHGSQGPIQAHVSMQTVAETAVLGGGVHPLHDEIGALARAVAAPEQLGQQGAP